MLNLNNVYNEEEDENKITMKLIDPRPTSTTKAPMPSLKEAATSLKRNSKSDCGEEVELKNLRRTNNEKDQSVTERYVYHFDSTKSLFSYFI